MIPFMHMRARHMTRVYALTPWRRIVANLCSSGLRSEVSKTNIGGIVLGASLYLSAVRARHDEPSARSPSFAQLRAARATWAGSRPSGTHVLLRPRSENLEIRVESMSYELRGDYPSEGHTCPGGTDHSWRCARRYRRTTHLDGPMLAPQRRHWGGFWFPNAEPAAN